MRLFGPALRGAGLALSAADFVTGASRPVAVGGYTFYVLELFVHGVGGHMKW